MPLIWQLSATHFGTKTLLHGVLVKGMPPLYTRQLGSIKNLFQLLGSYFVTLFDNEEIIIEANGKRIKATTDKNGAFSLELDFIVHDNVLIYTEGSNHQLDSVQQYPVIFPELEGPYEVISDIDDTVMVSYTADFFKRITTVAFKSPFKRKTISFTQDLFRALEKQKSRIFYVSKSESNLFGMISKFLDYHQLAKGDVFLTPYLKFSQLFSNKKGISLKEDRISFIISNSSKKIILVGDDSQKDMEVYANMVPEFPDRISKIYIRQTKISRSKRQLKNWEDLKATGVDIVYFNNIEEYGKR